jgi:hypothetical protein
MTVHFYADPAAVGSNNGVDWANAWTTWDTAMTGMSGRNGGVMDQDYVLHTRGDFVQAIRFDTGTAFTNNTASNTITFDGGYMDGIRGNEDTFLNYNATAAEAFLIRENYVRCNNMRIKGDSTSVTRFSLRLLTNAHLDFIANNVLCENPLSVEAHSVAVTSIFNNCIFDMHAGTNCNTAIAAGTLGNIQTVNFINNLFNYHRIVTLNYNTCNFINSMHITNAAISKAATSSVVNGDYSVFYTNEAANLNSSTGAIQNVGNVRAPWFANEGNGDFTYTSTALTTVRNAGIGPASDARVPTTALNGVTRSGTTCEIGPYEEANSTTYDVTMAVSSNRTIGFASQVEVFSTLAISSNRTITNTGVADITTAIAVSTSRTITNTGTVQVDGTISVTTNSTVTMTAAATFDGVVAVSTSHTVTESASAIFDSAVDTGIEVTISDAAMIEIIAAIVASTSHTAEYTAAITVDSAMTAGTTHGVTYTTQTEQGAVITISTAQTVTDNAMAEFGVSIGIDTTYNIDGTTANLSDVTQSVSALHSVAFSAQVEASGVLAVATQQSVAYDSNVIMGAGFIVGMVIDADMSSQSIVDCTISEAVTFGGNFAGTTGEGPPTPPARTLYVYNDNRTLYVPDDGRMLWIFD